MSRRGRRAPWRHDADDPRGRQQSADDELAADDEPVDGPAVRQLVVAVEQLFVKVAR